MNPLSARTFYARHKRHAALLLGLSVVVTVGLYSLVALVWAVFVDSPRSVPVPALRLASSVDAA